MFSFAFLFSLLFLALQVDNSDSVLIYHGVVMEDAKTGDKVELDKPLYVRNMSGFMGEVCGYSIHGALSDLPFRVVVLESFSGGASIVVDGRLDYEQQQSYSFSLSAHDCRDMVNMTHSERERVEISVEDVNDNPPRWVDSSYSVSVANLLKRGQQLVCLQVTDDDISRKFSNICRFTLYDKSERFYVDGKGCIYNKEVLVGPVATKIVHDLKVYAQDCGGLMTEGVEVHMEWELSCTYSWRAYERKIEIIESGNDSSSLPLFADVEFNSCDENDTCEVESLSVTLELLTPRDHECGRDKESLLAQRAFCGLKDEPPFLVENETAFNGNSTLLEITSDENLHLHSGDRFIISSWIKRARSGEEKEQILCHSDDSKITRRHTMWYVEGCRMVFILRSLSSIPSEEKIESQWEWTVPEVCSDEEGWHHYALSSAGGDKLTVDLYVDGRLFTTSRNHPKIVRKWKLHPLSHPPSSRIVIGACWIGRHGRMEELFYGWLSGLTISTNHTDVDQVIKCLSQCHERLTLENIQGIQSGTFVLLNEDNTHLTINSTSPLLLQNVLREVDLLMPRPLPGSRVIAIGTDISCKNSERLSFDSNNIEVVVSRPRPLKISTNRVVSIEEPTLSEGFKFMDDFQLEEVTGQPQVVIESCFVRGDSSMDLSNEMFLFNNDILRDLDLQVDLSNRGLFVGRVGEGVNPVRSYEQFMRSLRYSSKLGSQWRPRSFVIGCIGQNEELLTNHVVVSLKLVANHIEAPPLPGDMSRNNLLADQPVIRRSSIVATNTEDVNSMAGFWLPIFLVVCIGLLITMAILGLSKLRERRGESQVGGMDMEWDNSEMSIAVNPLFEMDDLNSMDRSEVFDDEDNGGDDEEEEDDDDYVNGDGATSEETRRDLEWDDLPY